MNGWLPAAAAVGRPSGFIQQRHRALRCPPASWVELLQRGYCNSAAHLCLTQGNRIPEREGRFSVLTDAWHIMLPLIIFLNRPFAGYIYHIKALMKQSSGRQDVLAEFENTSSPYLGAREKPGSSLHHIWLHEVRRSLPSLKHLYWLLKQHLAKWLPVLKQWVTFNCLTLSKAFTCFNTTCCSCSQKGFFTFKPVQGQICNKQLLTAKRVTRKHTILCWGTPKCVVAVELLVVSGFHAARDWALPCYCCVENFNCAHEPHGQQGEEAAQLLSCQLHAAIHWPIIHHRCDSAALQPLAQPQCNGSL